ncbi:MAG TPA: hypothetical protein VF800_02875 [Telluria sp.]|jgi:hypothetical protein
MSDVITFNNQGEFAASRAAEEWLRERGFSFGPSQADGPQAIWHGDCYVSKWRNLNAKDKREMHAVMDGDGRNGPIKIRLLPGASKEAINAFNRPAGAPP